MFGGWNQYELISIFYELVSSCLFRLIFTNWFQSEASILDLLAAGGGHSSKSGRRHISKEAKLTRLMVKNYGSSLSQKFE
jgi:hypothetical protein